ncbi:autotransporter outer membrane beta-barrel domain-containing protein [Citrobacter freundii]
MKHFKKLNIASAISLALLSQQTQAVVQIKDDVSLSDQAYTEALQWTPGAEGSALQLDKITVDAGVRGHAGVLVYDAIKNDITIRNSGLTGGEKGYGLRIDNATDSNVVVEKSALSASGNGVGATIKNFTDSALTVVGSTFTVDTGKGAEVHTATGSDILIQDTEINGGGSSVAYSSNTLSGSRLTFKDSTLTGGKRGVSVARATDGTVIALDNTTVHGAESGVSTTDLTDSALTITDSTLSADKTGLYVKNASNAVVSVSGGKITGGSEFGMFVKSMTDSTLNISGSTLTAGSKAGVETYATNSTLLVSDSTLSGKNNGLKATLNHSSLSIDNTVLKGIYGINLSGSDGDMVMTGSTTEGFYLGGGNFDVDIADSDIGNILISGQNASENYPKGGHTVNIDSSKLTKLDLLFGTTIAGNNTVNISGSELIADDENSDAIHIQDVSNNTVNVKDSVVKGNITNAIRYAPDGVTSGNVINLDNSYFEGAVVTVIEDSEGNPADRPGPGAAIYMGNGTTWKATGTSNAENINITDSTVDITDATVGADNWTSSNTEVLVNGNSQLNIADGKGDMNMVIKSDGKELEALGKEIVTVGKGDMDIQAEVADIGAYKYQLVKNKEGKWVLEQVGGTGGESGNGGQVVLSNTANAVLSGMAASLASWNSQTGTVYERLNSRLAEEGGSVWGTYYGSEWAGKAGLGSTFNQKINGLAIGADKTLQLNGATATLGAAVMHDDNHLSDFDEKGSGGSMNSTALQAYGKLSLDNGLFFKGTASAGRTSSKLHVRSSDGAMAKGDFRQTVFGLTGQAGYRYQVTEEVYVAPFVQMNGYTASGENFSMSNGMDVKSDRYWSARGEAGVEAGVDTTVGGIAVTPHVTLSAGHEFVKNNDVGLNGRAFNNTVDGSGYKVGAGVEARVTNNLSAGVNVSYSNSQDVEQRFGITAGLRYSF